MEIFNIRVGFHYHVPIYQTNDGSFKTASYFGVFLDSIAENCTELYGFLYCALESEKEKCNYTLISNNFIWVNLGPHDSIPSRYLRIRHTIESFKKYEPIIDVFLIRTPTPLIIALTRILPLKKTAIYIVGDYTVSKNLDVKQPKKLFIQILYYFMNSAEINFSKKCGLIVTNSQNLYDKFNLLSEKVRLVKSTSVSLRDFYIRKDTIKSKTINLLYTGRFDPIKNIPLIIESVKELNDEGIEVYFNMACTIDKYTVKYIELLKLLIKNLGVEDKVIFHGQKSIGKELNNIYRSCDIFILASSTEGFPRSIWDAMANSMPVIATTVGSIPHFLKNNIHALLIKPNDKNEIKNAIRKLINNNELRENLIKNGYELALDNTLELQGKRMVQVLDNYKNKLV
jgi:glycosyltransferase involved in cell wall biosynthesis